MTKIKALLIAASAGVYATPETVARLCNMEDDGLIERRADNRGVYIRHLTPTGRAALRKVSK